MGGYKNEKENHSSIIGTCTDTGAGGVQLLWKQIGVRRAGGHRGSGWSSG